MESKEHQTYAEIFASSAEDFFKFIDTIALQNGSPRGSGFLWRGVCDGEAHRLVPSAFRPKAWQTLLDARNLDAKGDNAWTQDQCTDSERPFLEWCAISLFYRHANAQGLILPPIPAHLHNLLVRRADVAFSDIAAHEVFGDKWPPRDLWAVKGLAQHYGVVTRLLDWSRNPYVATYFAARGGIDELLNDRRSNKTLAVWMTNSEILDRTSLYSPTRIEGAIDPGSRVHVIDVPYAGNANLAAQSGRFTMCVMASHHPNLKIDSPLEDIFGHIQLSVAGGIGGQLLQTPIKPFFKLMIPIQESARLLAALHNIGYDASRIYPGFRGAAMAIEESVLVRKLL